MFIDTSILFLYVIGNLFLSDALMGMMWRMFKINGVSHNPFLSIFYNVLIFSLVIVTIAAIIISKGKTVFLINVPILFLLFNSTRNRIVQPLRSDIPET